MFAVKAGFVLFKHFCANVLPFAVGQSHFMECPSFLFYTVKLTSISDWLP